MHQHAELLPCDPVPRIDVELVQQLHEVEDGRSVPPQCAEVAHGLEDILGVDVARLVLVKAAEEPAHLHPLPHDIEELR